MIEMKRSTHGWLVLIALSSASAVASAQSSSVTLSVHPPGPGDRWQLQFANTSANAVEIALDRRLLRAVITPPVAESALVSRRSRRIPRVYACRSVLASQRTTELPRVVLQPNAEHREAFDFLSVCGVRAIEKLVPGASVQFFYGTAGRRQTADHAVVFDAGTASEHVLPNELAASSPVIVPEGAKWVVPLPTNTPTTAALSLDISDSLEASVADGARVRVRLSARSSAPETAYFRPGMVSVEAISATGTRSVCSDAPRSYVGLRDYLRTFRARPSTVATINLGTMCARDVFDEPGMYLLRARFESNAPSSDGSRATFSGAITSRWIWFRVVRGRSTRPYQPLAANDPFAQRLAQ